ncbi:hypothetical protein [Alicyclobacillus macrosporangiidus]|uniref:hypothetical protein n=1 Tax=Alicyclobacillus macrosporangiidus TaxID=392015 RepID=UPI0004956750|nr:hypothetical protein [Alicyclobacillus macrosporangiidus]
MPTTMWRVGDWVRVQTAKKKRSSEDELERSVQEGEIIFVGRRFAVVQLSRYRETFWLDDLMPVTTMEDEEAVEREQQRRVLEWLGA